MKRRIGILTSGGDCPGLNAVIRAVTKTAIHRFHMDVIGIHGGFEGLILNRMQPLRYDDVSNILTLGGTVLGTTNRSDFLKMTPHGLKTESSIRRAVRNYKKARMEGVVCIGGDGSLTIGYELHKAGIPMIGVPKTIDNDVRLTDQTFGFDTASTIAAQAIDRLHSTAESHHRVMVIEVMGRNAGWIALQAGIAGGGDVILIPEIPYDFKIIAGYVRQRFQRQKRKSSIVVVAEGAYARGSEPTFQNRSTTARLGGISQVIAFDLEKATGIECRATILGYLQRGGTPTPFDRVLATRYGHHAAILAANKQYGAMVCLKNTEIRDVPLSLVAGKPRFIPLDSPLIQAAKDTGVSFGV